MRTIPFRKARTAGSDDSAADPGEFWIEADAENEADRRWLTDESGLDEEVVSRLLDPSPVTCWRRFGRGLHLNVCSAMPGASVETPGSINLGIWLEPGRIVTVSHGRVASLDRAADECATDDGPTSSWDLVIVMLSDALERLEDNYQDLNARIDGLEDEVVGGERKVSFSRVAELQQQLIVARRFRATVANLISFISSQPRGIVSGEVRDELDGIVNAFSQHHHMLDLAIDRAASLQGQIRDGLADSMNAATYRFTWVATVFLPLSFLTGLLGINVAGIPGDHNPAAFWLVCGALCVIAAIWGVIVGHFTSRLRNRPDRRDR